MKKIILLLIIVLFSCKDYGNPLSLDSNEDGDGNNQSYTYLDNIQPIFSSNCTQCHYLSSGYISYESYNDVISGGSVGNDLSSSSLYDRITREEFESGDMPPSGSLTIQQIELIASWINAGGLLEW